jgi:predicted  nucleic acid-binding Zn-ribbon protein
MLTNNDITRIVNATIEAGKEIFTTKEDFQELKADFNKLQTSVDKFAKKVSTRDDEIKVINHRLKKLENPA